MLERFKEIEKNAYVYRHRRLDTFEIFYIGIGTLKNYGRAFDKQKRNSYWNNIVTKAGYEVEIIADKLTWAEACELEIFLIKEYGRKDLGEGLLSNMTDGGDGNYGLIMSDQAKEKLRQKAIGRKKSYDTILKMKEKMKGKHSGENNPMFGKGGGSNPRAKLVLNLETGIFYDCAKDAAKVININYDYFKSMLNGRCKNNTSLIYV